MNSAPMIKKSNFYAIREKEELPTRKIITVFTTEEIEKLKAEASKAYATCNESEGYQQTRRARGIYR